MSKFVVDVNVIFSALIGGKDFHKQVFEKYDYFMPEYALAEVGEHKLLIMEKTKLDFEDLKNFTIFLFTNIAVIPEMCISERSVAQARTFIGEGDLDDMAYVALSVELGFPLVTRDKKLYKHLKANGFDNVLTFQQFDETYLSEN